MACHACLVEKVTWQWDGCQKDDVVAWDLSTTPSDLFCVVCDILLNSLSFGLQLWIKCFTYYKWSWKGKDVMYTLINNFGVLWFCIYYYTLIFDDYLLEQIFFLVSFYENGTLSYLKIKKITIKWDVTREEINNLFKLRNKHKENVQEWMMYFFYMCSKVYRLQRLTSLSIGK